MIPIEIDSFHFFRVPPEKANGKKPEGYIEDETVPKESDNGEYIRCRQCYQVLTRPAERIAVQGTHQHTFANPQGIVYHVGCFRSVRGCGYVGPATDEFTWFRGFSWRIAICSMCLTHLGWFFMSKGNESFNGLILDRLIGP